MMKLYFMLEGLINFLLNKSAANIHMFNNEENLVLSKFKQAFAPKVDFVSRILKKIEQTLHSSATPKDNFSKYAGVILAGSCLKSLISSYDRLSKGYLTDCEALLKKSIEGFFYQAYFHENKNEAKLWCQNNTKPKLNYYDLAVKLDKSQFISKFFPTDYENFFTEYIYRVGYTQSNRLAHLDFDMVHFEMGLENEDQTQFATTMVLGPKYEFKMMKTTLNRLIMFSMFQLSLLLYITDQKGGEEYTSLFSELKKTFL